ncbi:hypothetical protein ACP275_06G126900 [Erythranthe tilingii]
MNSEKLNNKAVEEDDLLREFAVGVSIATILSLAPSYPDLLAVPHIFIKRFENVVARSIKTRCPLTFDKVKKCLEDLKNFAVDSAFCGAHASTEHVENINEEGYFGNDSDPVRNSIQFMMGLRTEFSWWDGLIEHLDRFDQGGCGACWAVVACILASCQFKIEHGSFIVASPQHIIDVFDRDYKDYLVDEADGNRCKPGCVAFALEYIQKQGVNMDINYTWAGFITNREIPFDSERLWINSFKIFEHASFEEVLQEIHQHPVAGLIDANESFMSYNDGKVVFQGEPNQSADNRSMTKPHVIAVFGHGIFNGHPFLEILNSFGPGWGSNGCGRVLARLVKPLGSATGAYLARGAYLTPAQNQQEDNMDVD